MVARHSIPYPTDCYQHNIGIGDGSDDDDSDWPQIASADKIPAHRDWLDLISDANSYLTVHFLFTYLFTCLALRFLYKNYQRYIRSRQLFSLELVHSIPGRTVMITSLPLHFRSERALAEYFENIGLSVESVSVCREVGTLQVLLDQRTKALLKLEREWTKYVGNPSVVESYDPSENVIPQSSDAEPSVLESQSARLVVPHRRRPTLRPGWCSSKVDALEYLEAKFKEADEKVKRWRRIGKTRSTHVAFVTFEKMSSAVRPSIVVVVVVLIFLLLSKSQCKRRTRPIHWRRRLTQRRNRGTSSGRTSNILRAHCFVDSSWCSPLSGC